MNLEKIICHQCQMKILRQLVMYKGGCIPLNALGCVFLGGMECEWKEFADEIIRTIEKDFSQRYIPGHPRVNGMYKEIKSDEPA